MRKYKNSMRPEEDETFLTLVWPNGTFRLDREARTAFVDLSFEHADKLADWMRTKIMDARPEMLKRMKQTKKDKEGM